MPLKEETIAALVTRYVKDGQVIAFGTGSHAETFAKKLALRMEIEELNASVVPTSMRLAQILSELKVPITSIDDKEIDVAIEFVDLVDKHFNFIKKDSLSLVRDKMIAQSAAELIVITSEENFVNRLNGRIPFEVATFGWNRTLVQLEAFGTAKLRKRKKEPFKTETGHYIIDVKVDEIYSLEDLEYQAKEIPGVLETGLFIGYADRIILHNEKLSVKSRLDFEQQNIIRE